MRSVGGQDVPYGLNMLLKKSLEDPRNSLAEKRINLNICFNGKGTLADFPPAFFCALSFTF